MILSISIQGQLVLSGIGINTRQFVQDRYIFRNGIIEDVPIGRIFGLTLGYQYKNFEWRPYIEPKLLENTANGVLSTNLKLARSLTIQNGADCVFFSSQLFYKINRGEIGKQFIKPQVILGVIDRIQSATD
jgi:hypothetical protein